MALAKDLIAEKNASEYDAHAASWHASMGTNVGHKYLEKPAMEQQLPATLAGKAVLCVGVGTGDELQDILKRNPSRVVGIDISAGLLAIAAARFPAVEFIKVNMTATGFPEASFEFVYSSLTFHYARDWDLLCSEIYRLLKDNGSLLFSTHHPGYWSQKTATGATYTNKRGITLTEHTALLPGEVEIVYYNHQNADAILDALEYAGFQIEKHFNPIVTAAPVDSLSQEEVTAYRELQKINEESPLFFVVKAVKKRKR